MQIMDYLGVAQFVILLGTAVITGFNSKQGMKMALLLAEMQLNMRKELNGRYLSITRFEDYAHHIEKLEEAKRNGKHLG